VYLTLISLLLLDILKNENSFLGNFIGIQQSFSMDIKVQKQLQDQAISVLMSVRYTRAFIKLYKCNFIIFSATKLSNRMSSWERDNLAHCSNIQSDLKDYARCLEPVWSFGMQKIRINQRKKGQIRKRRHISLESAQWSLIREENVQVQQLNVENMPKSALGVRT